MDNKNKIEQVVVLTPCKDSISDECFKSIQNQDYGNFSGIVNRKTFVEYPEHDLGKQITLNIISNRTELIKKALETDANWFLWVDADIVLPKDAISRLMAHKRDAVSGVYKTRDNQNQYCFGKWVANNVCWCATYNQKCLLKVDWTGFGCFLMSRRILERLHLDDSAITTFCEDPSGTRFHLGDCLIACNQITDMGFLTYVDGNVECKHLV